jgi:hypothetical protein
MEPMILLGFKESHQREAKIIQRPMQTAGDNELFEMQPETFNGIEKRAVLGQPEHEEPVSIQAQVGLVAAER